jgi:hypothetical protein
MRARSSIVCAIFAVGALASPAFCADEEMVEVMPQLKLTKAQVKLIDENFKTLQSNQALIEKVLNHLKIDYYVPVLPHYRSIGANAIMSLTDQFYYAAAAKKLGAKLPENYKGESGSSLKNNLFLHDYNNEILRSIAKKLGLSTPEKPAESEASEEIMQKVIKQNHEILSSIATKLGVKP